MKFFLSWLCVLLVSFCACKREYSYEGGTVASSNFLAKDAGGNCSLIEVHGSFAKDSSLTDSNYVMVLVRVLQRGNYSIASNNTSGFSFSAKGNFIDTGLVRVKLVASGLPTVASHANFTVTYNASVCTFSVEVKAFNPPVVITNDPELFPFSAGSHWLYDDLTFPGNYINNTVILDSTLGAIVYKRTDEFKSFYPATNPRYYAKQGKNYLRYVSVSSYTSALNFSPSIYDDFVFLKDSLAAGDTWDSKTYTGRNATGTVLKSLRLTCTCLAADDTLTVNNRLFAHVCKMKITPFVGDPGTTLQPTGEVHTYWYAKGIGLVYEEFFNGVLPHGVQAIKSWLVN